MDNTAVSCGRERLVKMATAQRAVILLYLAWIALSFFLSAALIALAAVLGLQERLSGLVTTVDLAIRIVFFVLVALQGGRLARAVEGEKALAYRILFWIPCLSLVALLILSSRSNRIMRENGVKVGFLGVDPSSIP